jgi:hypothetical protein
MHTECFGGSFVFCIQETAHKTGILPLSLTILCVTGKLMTFSIINVFDLDLRTKKGIDFGSPILLQTG